MRRITEIIIHCSDTPAGKDFTAADIDRWHKNRGWKCIGYHFVIDLDGTIERGRPISDEGAHCKACGKNKTSIGICYIGGRDENGECADTRTDAQRKSMYKLVSELVASHRCDVFGHRDFEKGKLCPCFDAHEEYHYLYCRSTVDMVAHQLHTLIKKS